MAPGTRGARGGVELILAMIGVIADPEDEQVVCEFFELFKIPWESYHRGRRYDVVICTRDAALAEAAKLVVIYAGKRTRFDEEHRIRTARQRSHACILQHPIGRIPAYGGTMTFAETGTRLLSDSESGECAAWFDNSGTTMLARIGYDLLEEVRILLSEGQPPANGAIPALELHIALLRDLITGCGVPLAEIPPVPEGYRFIACLTHDVDHPSIRRHKWDHTTLGFLYRALVGSLRHVVNGRTGWRDLARNWAAALKLPLVQLGLAKDFWGDFSDRYAEIENGARSTIFVIPFSGRPGQKPDGPAPRFRAARYGAADIADTIEGLRAAGCEVALHGIEAWRDAARGREELEEIRRLTGASEVGVRMHWLYYDQRSPRVLEEAGAAYDSTMGYNGTAGYRAGTTQAYQPIGARRLLELPLHVMDTSLFYPAHLGLSQQQGKALIGAMMDDVSEFGGCLTINWHDRSLAPERLWGSCYRQLVAELKERGAWLATAGQAAAWFRKRRSARFGADSSAPAGVRASVGADDLPGLRLRIHPARKSPGTGTPGPGYADAAVDSPVEDRAACGAGR